MLEIVNCPHCGWTLGDSSAEKCSHCGKRLDAPVRRRGEKGPLGQFLSSWWFNFTHRDFRRACESDRAHIVHTSVSGSEEVAVGNQLQSRLSLQTSMSEEGRKAWEKFRQERKRNFVQLRCPRCKHSYVLQVWSILAEPRGYVASCESSWCSISMGALGGNTMRCPNCGESVRPRVRRLNRLGSIPTEGYDPHRGLRPY